MIDLAELKPSTVKALKNLYKDNKDTIEYMQKFGSAFEKSIAVLILAASGEDQNA